MKSLMYKELTHFFGSLTGVVVIGVYLLINGLVLWILPGNFNLLDSGWANLDGLFVVSPWIFLFLIPAITMRMFSEERRNGTLELLCTLPLRDWEIVGAKFVAALVLVVLSIVPTLLYFCSIHALGAPVGSIDHGGTWGSYLGLVFLGAAYAAIGLFASSLTDNPIVGFLLAAFLCGLVYAGFDALGGLAGQTAVGLFLPELGLSQHYTAVSRGVLDSRDLLYFLCLPALFLGGAGLQLKSRSW
ncbi:gliding motility-associated ABC transporter permease subunit GldF [bacterium]|nr:gliding motility-associated ABC transporter permease subunit GldF [bacterium]